MRDFNGKLAVVTGGASGVGFAIGEALAKEGARVVLTDIEQKSLEKSAALLTVNLLMFIPRLQMFLILILCKNLQVGAYLNMAQFIYFLIMQELLLQNYCQFGIQTKRLAMGLWGKCYGSPSWHSSICSWNVSPWRRITSY